MALERQVMFWVAALVVLVGALWLLAGILLPFVAGMGLAYLLDPIARWAGRLGIGRAVSALIVVTLVIVVLVVVAMLVAPILSDQFTAFMDNLPGYLTRLQSLVADPSRPWLAKIFGERLSDGGKSLGGLAAQGSGWIATFLASLWTGGRAVFSVLSLIGLVLIVLGYHKLQLMPGKNPQLWSPPVWTRHLAFVLMLPSFVLLVAAYVPSRIRTAVKHPMLAAVKIWAFAHLLANGDLGSIVLFGSFLAWGVYARIAAKRRGALHEIKDQLATLRGLVKWAERIERPEDVPAVMRDVVDECLALARAAGVQVPGDMHAVVQGLAQTMPGQLSSTAQDLARGKKSEIDHLNGVVVRKGEALGVRTPANRTLLALVKLLEDRK